MSVTFGLMFIGGFLAILLVGVPLFLGGILLGYVKWGRHS